MEGAKPVTFKMFLRSNPKWCLSSVPNDHQRTIAFARCCSSHNVCFFTKGSYFWVCWYVMEGLERSL